MVKKQNSCDDAEVKGDSLLVAFENKRQHKKQAEENNNHGCTSQRFTNHSYEI